MSDPAPPPADVSGTVDPADPGDRLNPDATRPPFAWTLDIPTGPGWHQLDTSPDWLASLDTLLDEHLTGPATTGEERRAIRRSLADLVTTCRNDGVLLSLLHVLTLPGEDGRDGAAGTTLTAGMHLAWYDSSPQPASTTLIRRALTGDAGTTTEVHVGADPTGPQTVIVHTGTPTTAPPAVHARAGTTVTSVQVYAPLPHRSWTAIVSTASPHPALTELLRETATTLAASIRTPPPAPEPEPEPVASGPGADRDTPWENRIYRPT